MIHSTCWSAPRPPSHARLATPVRPRPYGCVGLQVGGDEGSVPLDMVKQKPLNVARDLLMYFHSMQPNDDKCPPPTPPAAIPITRLMPSPYSAA